MKIEASTEILCKPEKVFSWIENPDKAMLWQKGVKSGEVINETPERVGTTFKEVLEENGKSLVMFGEITGFIPDKSISFHLESKIHIVDVNYSVTADSNKSKVLVQSTVNWKFPMSVICFMAGKKIMSKIKQELNNELAVLKQLCEAESS